MALPQSSLPPFCSQPLRIEFRRSQRNAKHHGLTPLQIRFEPQRAQRTQRTFGRVGRTLSGLSARGGVSRAVGAGELNCSANHGLTLMDTDRKSGGYGENFNIQCPISNIQCSSGRSHFSRQAARLRQGYGGQAKPQRGLLEGRPPCRPGDPDTPNATIHGLTPLQIRFEPQRAQRTFGRVGRTLSGLSARGGMSRAVGSENFNIQCPISNVQVVGVISHAKPPAFAKATVGKPRREGESCQGCLALLFDQRSTTNNQRPRPPTIFDFDPARNG